MLEPWLPLAPTPLRTLILFIGVQKCYNKSFKLFRQTHVVLVQGSSSYLTLLVLTMENVFTYLLMDNGYGVLHMSK